MAAPGNAQKGDYPLGAGLVKGNWKAKKTNNLSAFLQMIPVFH
jgi:hypothetical protein